jgi:hypothetical protein
MIEIITKKYILKVSMNVRNKEYVWAILEIKSKNNQELAGWLMQYF